MRRAPPVHSNRPIRIETTSSGISRQNVAAMIRTGNDGRFWKMRMTPLSTRSTAPPRKPAAVPIAIEIAEAMIAEANPTNIEL